MQAFNWIDSGSLSAKVAFDWNVQAKFLETVDGKVPDLSSAFFASKEIPNHQWKLQLSDLGAKLRISLLHYVNTKGILANNVDPFQVKIAIVDKNGVKHHQYVVYLHIHTFVYFDLSKEEILTSNYRQLDGSLTISCVNECVVWQPSSGIPQPMGINYTHQLRLTTHIEELFDDISFSDVIFKVGGSEFPAHKIILAARSEVFYAMFQHPTKEKSTNHVEIEDIEPEIFKELLRFIYTGRLTAATMEKMAVKLLVVADKYLLTELKAACERHLITLMSIENCLELLTLEENDHHPAYELREEAINLFRLHPAEVISTDGWKKAKKENLALLFDVQEVAFSLQGCQLADNEFRAAK
ncbi:speckle-type POZ protein B-like [Daphnia pulicaria]|jgi:speckle-type POZ protein|uniref:speckle-type POZ protein B-like n=1 Tax=Daphnia pulicaria TaxID=35523 RepID=UPI001EEBA2F3|nr:speckle-type POZ protein B-like [Daphnia pulicaria]XP_046648373.1 speckle-type POZ protein B-like [Daphnia pulicaria]